MKEPTNGSSLHAQSRWEKDVVGDTVSKKDAY